MYTKTTLDNFVEFVYVIHASLESIGKLLENIGLFVTFNLV